MNAKVVSPVIQGFKESFKLSAGLVLAVGSVISSFAAHSLSLRDRVNQQSTPSAEHKPNSHPC